MMNRADDHEVEPLVASVEQQAPRVTTSRRKERKNFRSLCFLICVSLAVIALLSCLYVNKETVFDLRKSSTSYIRKKVDSAFSKKGKTVDGATSHEGKNVDGDIPKQAEKQKTKAVVHVGPQKTGSTTLQWAWASPGGLLNTLKEDNYRFAFINPHRGYFNCDVTPSGGWTDCQPSPKLKTFAGNAKTAGQNLLLTDENLDDRFVMPLKGLLPTDDWEVTVVVVYRRIHEWLVSWYNQINKTTNLDKNGNVLLNEEGKPYRMAHKWWPDQGGTEIPVFSKWYKTFTKNYDRSDLVSRHKTVERVNTFKNVFDNIVVHNMHKEGDLITNFMCDSMPDATYSCDRLKKGAVHLPSRNGSVNLDADIIAVEARRRGLLQKALSRQDVSDAVLGYMERTGKLIPRKCDQEMIDEIRGWLLDSEKEVFSSTWTEKTKLELNQTYELYLQKGKLCDVDFNAVFSDDEWVSFLSSIDNKKDLILHIGPQKTGSTTLQNAWASAQELGELLRQDHFSYKRINPWTGAFDCNVGVAETRFSNCRASKDLKEFIAAEIAKGRNLLLSDENLNENFAEALRSVIDEAQFREVKVVAVYRRIHEWLFSWWKQLNQYTNKDADGNLLVDKDGNPTHEPHKHFPEHGGERVPSFGEWYKTFVQRFNMDELASEHPSVHVVNSYKAYFDHVQVFDMHQDGDLVTNFMCQMIPEATKSCSALQTALENGVELPSEKESDDLAYDIISVYTYEEGFVRKDITRPLLNAAVKFFFEKSGATIPRKKCDDEMVDQIRNWFYESEKIMFPDKFNPSRKNELEQVFESYLTEGNICDVDLKTIVNNHDFLEFLESLKELDLTPYADPPSDAEKNHLVLHVGPQKTGSSTLQAAWEILGPELDQDNYRFRHVSPEASDFDCHVSRWGGYTDCKATDNLKSFIEESQKSGANVLLSDENLDERFAQPLRDVIDDSLWHVTVVVAYRGIHEWLVSWYNQINKTTNLDANGKLLIDENGNPYREAHKYWPDEGGARIPSFSSWYSEFTQNWDPSELVDNHRSLKFFHEYTPLFDNVVVYDMHKKGDLVTNFMCDIIPRADHSCLKLQNQQVNIPIFNPSVQLETDILSVYAYDQGYISKSLSRQEVAEAVTKYMKESDKSIPRLCNAEMTKEVFEWLVNSEQAMFPDKWSPKRHAELTEAFKSFFLTGKLCDVDVEEAMRDEDWIDFFQSLG